MATTTTCARCKCETHFPKMSLIDYKFICRACRKKEDLENDQCRDEEKKK